MPISFNDYRIYLNGTEITPTVSKLDPSFSRGQNPPAKKQPKIIVIGDNVIKRSWCRFCFRTHLDSEQVECARLAHEVHASEDFWTPEHITAWRGFKIVPDPDYDYGPILRGARAEWKSTDPGPAECIGHGNSVVPFDHKSPHALCACGYHALKDRKDISPRFTVHAKVLMWGDIIEHEDGYRSERIKLEQISYTNMGSFKFQRRERVHHTMHKLRERYKVGEIT